jgi:hypothetical protein
MTTSKVHIINAIVNKEYLMNFLMVFFIGFIQSSSIFIRAEIFIPP